MLLIRLLLLLFLIDGACATVAASPALYPFCISGSCGLVDRNGNWQAKPDYASVRASGRFWVVERRSGLVGLLDSGGKVLIPPSLREIGIFADGLAPARGPRSNEYGYIRPDGSWAIEPRYFSASPFIDGVAQVGNRTPGELQTLAGFIRQDGKPAIEKRFYASSNSISHVKGLALVEVGDRDGKDTRSALIDRSGRFIVPPRDDQYIELGSDGSIVVRRGNGYALFDSGGKKLLEVGGDEAIIRSVGDGLVYFEQPGRGVGLASARDGRVIVAPRRDWTWIDQFSEGLAAVHVLAGKGIERVGFIDHTGAVLIAPAFATATTFHGGLAAASDGEGREGVIDRRGRWLRPPTAGQNVHPLVDDEAGDAPHLNGVLVIDHDLPAGPTSPYPPEKADATPAAQLAPRTEYLLQGRRLAGVYRHPCGVDVAINAAGERIWPENLLGRCAAEQASMRRSGGEEEHPLGALQAYGEEKRRKLREDAEWMAEVRRRDRYTGGVEGLTTRYLYPELAERRQRQARLVEEAGWLTGEQDVDLGRAVRLHLPAGMKILPPDRTQALRRLILAEQAQPLPLPAGYRALQEQLAAGTLSQPEFDKQAARWRALFPEAFKPQKEEKAPPEIRGNASALVAGKDDRWQGILFITEAGGLRLEEGSLQKPDEVLETLRTYGFWRNTGGLSTTVTGISLYEWIQAPLLEQRPRMLSWAFHYSDLYTGGGPGHGFGRGAVVNVLIPGRRTVAQMHASWSGPFAEAEANQYLPEIQALSRGLHFAAGEGYDDYTAGDPRIKTPLARLMTGSPPEALEKFGNAVQKAIKRDEDERRSRIFELLLELGGVGATMVILFLRRQKRTAEALPKEVRVKGRKSRPGRRKQ